MVLDQPSDEPGSSRGDVTSIRTESSILAPDLQLDCLETDDDDDDDDDEDVVHTTAQPQSTLFPCTESISVDSSDTATTSADSGEDGPSTAPPRVIRPHQRVRSASTSDTGHLPKIRRLNSHRDPFGHHNSVFSNNLYMPHALLLRRQQLQREIHRRSIIPTRDNGELDLPLSLARHRILVNNTGAIGSHFNRLLQLVGMRGLNMGLRQDVIEQHTSTSKYLAEDVADKEEDREKCTICLVNFEGNIEIRTLGCKHLFHTNCVDRWLRSNKQCPMCRLQVDSHSPLSIDPNVADAPSEGNVAEAGDNTLSRQSPPSSPSSS